MLTPTIIQIVFWIGVGFSVLTGLMSIITGLSRFGSGFQVLFGLIFIIIGPLIVRIYCELLIVIFKMHESLDMIQKRLDHQHVQQNTFE